MCVEASIEVNNSAPSTPFEAIFGPEGRSLILGPEGHRTSSFGRTKNVRAEVSSTQLQVRKIRPLSFLEFGFPLSNFVHEFFLEPGSTFSRAHKNSIPMGIAKYKTLILMEYGEYEIWNIYDVEEERATRSVWEYGIITMRHTCSATV